MSKKVQLKMGFLMGILMHNHLVPLDQMFHFYQGPVLFLKGHIIL